MLQSCFQPPLPSFFMIPHSLRHNTGMINKIIVFSSSSASFLLHISFCTSHASLHFSDSKKVDEVLKKNNFEMAGKKVFAVPAYKSLLTNYPEVSSFKYNNITLHLFLDYNLFYPFTGKY